MKKIISGSILVTTMLYAMPAATPVEEKYTMNSEVVQGKLMGDEYLNWVETKEGKIIRYNKSKKRYEYLKEENGEIKYSNIKYNKTTSTSNINRSSAIVSSQIKKEKVSTPKLDKKLMLKIWKKKMKNKSFNNYN